MYHTMVELPMYKQLHVPIILSLPEWEKRFLSRATRAKKCNYKENFQKCYELVQIARSCNARHVEVRSSSTSMMFIFDFIDEECVDKFTQYLLDDKFYQL